MPPQLIRFHGSYRYPSRHALERAVASARAQLDEDDDGDRAAAALRTLVAYGSVLDIDVVLPAAADTRFAAADMFLTLARDAIAGAVEAHDGECGIDVFAPGDSSD